ncbi:MAG: EthD domain-containing protein [Pseudomonadota bacterium]
MAVKLVFCVRKRDDLSSEEFYKYWLTRHGPLAREMLPKANARKYIQSHTVAPDINAALIQSRDLEDPYDGITEVWWDSLEDMQAGLATPEGNDAVNNILKEDEAVFVDLKRCRVFMTEEHTIFE